VLKYVIVVVALTVGACAPAKRAGSAAKTAAILCAKQDASSIASLLASFAVRSAIAGKLDVKELETVATGAGLGVASCAFGAFLAEWKRLRKAEPVALMGEPDVTVQLQQALARVSGGATVVLADGTEVR
jgi:hypothetical protein